MNYDKEILELSLKKLSLAFDEFISECLTEDGKPKEPTIQAIMKSKGYLPSYCKNSYKKKPK